MTYNYSQKLPLTKNLIAQTGVNLTFTRSGRQNYYDVGDKTWKSKTASNDPCITALGVLNERARTNKTTADNCNPTATTNISVTSGSVSIANDASNLSKSGLSTLCYTGNVFYYSNTTTSSQTITITGTTGTVSSAAALSVFAYSTESRCTLQLTGAVGAVPIPVMNPDLPYLRVRSESVVPGTTSDQLQIVVPAGSKVHFILQQLEIGESSTDADVTSPIIIVSRAATTRNVCQMSVSQSVTSIIPTNNSTICLEVTPTSQNQPLSYIFDVYANAGADRIRLQGKGSADKTISSTTYTSNGRWTFQEGRTSKLAVRMSTNFLHGTFCDGSRPNTQPASSNVNVVSGITSALIYVGRKQDGSTSSGFNGWIRNFEIIKENLSDDQVSDYTNNHADISYFYNIGVPLHDKNNPATIWALGGYNGSAYSKIVRSDDYGKNFRDVVTLSVTTNQSALQRDKSGNFYYATSKTLRRITPDLKTDAVVISFDTAMFVSPTTRNWSWFTWCWGEDIQGNLYTAGYTLDGLQGQVFYKSSNSGSSWTANTTLASTYTSERHIHSLHVNPYDNRLYISIGDGASRNNFVTNAALDVWDSATFVTLGTTTYGGGNAKGCTGITFTTEGVYFSSDGVGSQNIITRNNAYSGDQLSFAMPTNFQITPLYYCRARGDNELWVTAVNESAVTNASGGLFKLIKDGGPTSQWRLARIVALDDVAYNGKAYYAIAHDGSGMIPKNTKFVFVQLYNHTRDEPGPVVRVSIDEANVFSTNVPEYNKEYSSVSEIFHCFGLALAQKGHDFSTAKIKCLLTNTVPDLSNTMRSDIIELTGGGYSDGGYDVSTVSEYSQSGQYSLFVDDLEIAAGNDAVGPFRYLVFYDSSAKDNNLIVYYDLGQSISIDALAFVKAAFAGPLVNMKWQTI